MNNNHIAVTQFAELLNGREYLEELTKEEEQFAKDNGLVVVFGASDHLCEFRGAIYDEVGAYGGTIVHFNNGEILTNKCKEDCPYFQAAIEENVNQIEIFQYRNNITFTYRATFDYEEFEILDEGELYCIGIVFHIDSIKE